uniref:Fibronectin type-III domain-containing protein n=1 Tax=Meloidogyne hapla TaxID=6305 RepID=A0A1I8BNQ0_MELHA
MLQRVRDAFKEYLVTLISLFINQHLFTSNFWFSIFLSLISTLNYCNAISVEQCCIRERIPDICVRTLCNPASPPSDFDVYDVFDRRNNCSRYLDPVAKCLAAGRDHSPCCSKEAKDLEENACFGNFEKGYQRIPSSPRNLVIGQVSSTEAELSWQEPEHNSKLVDHYLIYIYELETSSEKADLSTELRIETMAKEARINQLEPGTRYLLQIISLGFGSSKDENELPRSLPTELRFKTSGIAPQAKPFKEKIYSALGSDTLLACRIRTRQLIIQKY